MSQAFEDHLTAPRGQGRLAQAPHQGAAGGAACGDLVRIAVRVEDGVVAGAGFDARGCASVRACASAAVELVEGTPLLEAARLGAREVAAELGGLTPAAAHGASLVAEALHRALGSAAAGGALRLEPPRAGRTLVAMSGGVDSAAAARLALEAGSDVVAVTLELWADSENDGARSCCSPQAVGGARALAHEMGLPHLTLDLREQFRREVVEDFIREHAAGRTPNPCVRCNGLVRFEEMLRLADDLGAERLATGHYARIERDESDDEKGPLVSCAADPAKDQAYVLARLAPAQLERLWFPLGELEKPAVRELAREAGLSVADRPESQDLCFLAGLDGERFLRRHGGSALPVARGGPDADPGEHGEHGEIVDLAGTVLGYHRGQHAFTVGQRRGIGVAASEPLYVVHKDAAADRITVGPRSALATSSVRIEDAVLRRPGASVDRVKLRYRAEPVPCRVEGEPAAGEHPDLTIALAESVERPAPGQTACLMEGERVLGAGIVRY